MNNAICLKCGYDADINSFRVTPMDEGDMNPVIECPKCWGCAEASNGDELQAMGMEEVTNKHVTESFERIQASIKEESDRLIVKIKPVIDSIAFGNTSLRQTSVILTKEQIELRVEQNNALIKRYTELIYKVILEESQIS
jgi:hypothetical protein